MFVNMFISIGICKIKYIDQCLPALYNNKTYLVFWKTILYCNEIVALLFLYFNSVSAYYDAKMLCPQADFVNLWTFDFRTPKRSKPQADYTAPLYYMYDRNPHQNADAHVKWWKENGCDRKSLNMVPFN